MIFTYSFDLVTAKHSKIASAFVSGVVIAQDRDEAVKITEALAKDTLISIEGSISVEGTLS